MRLRPLAISYLRASKVMSVSLPAPIRKEALELSLFHGHLALLVIIDELFHEIGNRGRDAEAVLDLGLYVALMSVSILLNRFFRMIANTPG